MIEGIDLFVSKLRFVAVGAIMLVSLLTLPYFLSVVWVTPKAHAEGTKPASPTAPLDDNPNIISQGAYSAVATVGQAANSVVSAAAQSGKTAAHGIGDGVNLVAKSVGGSASFVAHTTGSVFGAIPKIPHVSQIIRPQDKTPIAAIDADNSVVPSTPAAVTAQKEVPQQVDAEAQWPIHGIVTLEFGMPHWPFQATHTGIDISDGARSGVTPVRPFKPGRVVQVIHSNEGFGNHVIIDHGNGLTSLYGHMASISVQVGQEVNESTLLGREGTTGASTGVHLHFEVRLNGQPVNPHKYVGGQP